MKIIAITGYGQPRDRERSKEAGFESHLVRPVEHIDRIRAMLTSSTVNTAVNTGEPRERK